MFKKYQKIMVFLGMLAVAVIVFCIYQFLVLRTAHSTFENYYAFRGCVRLIQKTDDYGICALASGQQIKIVKIGDAWYLDGDGPGVW